MVSVSSIPKIDRHYSDSHKILQIILLSFSCNSVVMNNKDLTKVVDLSCRSKYTEKKTPSPWVVLLLGICCVI